MAVVIGNCFYFLSAETWMKQKRLKFLGMPRYLGCGSHEYRGERYRFIVLERYGKDFTKIFEESGRRFHLKTVLYLGMQIVSILFYGIRIQ